MRDLKTIIADNLNPQQHRRRTILAGAFDRPNDDVTAAAFADRATLEEAFRHERLRERQRQNGPWKRKPLTGRDVFRAGQDRNGGVI